MNLIYEARGRAREYSELAVNLYRGCDHMCIYCFGPDTIHAKRQDFTHPRPRMPALKLFDLLTKDLQAMQEKGERREVLMSFTTDPYNEADQDCQITRNAIGLFIQHGIRFAILTKAGLKSIRDFDYMETRKDLCRYGASLTFDNLEDGFKWEPRAASNQERIVALKMAHGRGIRTFASMEPMIWPAQSLALITKSLPYVDEYRLGKLNHHPAPHQINYRAYLTEAIRILKEAGKPYIIKSDLAKAAGTG